jgi:hypothetical protein
MLSVQSQPEEHTPSIFRAEEETKREISMKQVESSAGLATEYTELYHRKWKT